MSTLMKLTPIVDKVALVGLALRGAEPGWLYLKAFDVDARGGFGSVALTPDRSKALRFKDPGEAMQAWKKQSTIMPLRPDGKPNRPLTAYTATFEEV